MALPVAGGDDYPPFRPSGGPYYPAKRRPIDAVDDDELYYSRHKRPKYVQQAQFAGPVAFKAAEPPLNNYPPVHHPHPHHSHHSHHPCHPHHRYPSPRPHVPSPEPVGIAAAPAMERTASGHSIRPDATEGWALTELLEDRDAAQRVRDHLATFRRRNPDSKHERILRSIINPRPRRHPRHHSHHHSRSHSRNSHHFPDSSSSSSNTTTTNPNLNPTPTGNSGEEDSEYPLDNDALESIFSAANEIFFNGRLSQRVAWDWSHASSARYDSRVIGTTALRRAAAHTRGFETLIVLSASILRDGGFSRRLLISTFLHELIHCYLFICCGFRARWEGGHTDGFREIAGLIDEWVGEGGGLYLRRVEADLDLFRVGGGCSGRGGCEGEGGVPLVDDRGERGDGGDGRFGMAPNVYPCSGMAAEQEEYTVTASAAAVAAFPSPATQEAVYFGTGGGNGPVAGQETVYYGRGSPSPRPGTPTRELVYFGRGSPSPRPGTPTREMVQYGDRALSSSGSNGSNVWWRHRRAGRPLYVYSGDDSSPSYVYTHPTGQRP
ncbi:uncharacterized protein B0H64DRAFT_437300 [Chaetomium fimeti]|uniref:SprT-like domain-containing protein n=1 Tax=Chaetomium fimeti TaxID=1854472 RepID=A0AAE0HP30_9PEZI|nr:hypothetical protein B0H64DRAFT_437300 [Chaetomium fimeti]